MQTIFRLCLTVALLGLYCSPVSAQEEEIIPGLECHYNSQRTAPTAKTPNGPESWHGFWFAGDGGWIFRGNGKGPLGNSQIKGACGGGQCEFGQSYVSGKLKGKGHTYQHRYTGELGEQGPLKINFKGHWGQGNSYTAADNWQFKAAGPWSSTAKCKAKGNIGDLPKVLGWDVWG